MSMPEPDAPNTEPARPSKLKKTLKWLAIFGTVLLTLFLCLGLLLTYLFPDEFVQQELEVRLSEQLQGTVRIESLSFNLLTGLQLQNVEFLQQDQPQLTLQELILDYDLLELFQQRLQINEVRIDSATIDLNLAETTRTPAPKEQTPTPSQESPEPASLPAVPLSLALNTFVISHSNINVVISPTLAVSLTDLNVDISGAVTEKLADLSGSLDIATLALDLDEKKIDLPVSLTVALSADLPHEQLTVQRLTVKSDPAIRLTLVGQINNFLSQPDMDLSLRNAALDLEKLLLIGKDFLPPDLGTIDASGTLSPEITIQGTMRESGFQGNVRAKVNAQGFQAHLPMFHTTLHPTDLLVETSDLAIRDSAPESSSLTVSLNSAGADVQDHSVTGIDLGVSGRIQEGQAELSGSLEVSEVQAAVEDKSVQLPLAVHFALSADPDKQNIELQQLTMQADPAVNLTLSGHVKDFQTRKSVDLSLGNSRIDLEQVFFLVKDFMPPDMKDISVNGTVIPEVRLTGTLPDSGFTGTVQVEVHAQDLQAALPAFGTTVRPTNLDISASDLIITDNVPQSGQVQVTLSSTGTTFQDYTVADLGLNLSGEYAASGPVSGTVRLAGVSTLPPIGPLSTLTLPFAVEVDAGGNLHAQDLALKQFTVTVGDLLDLQAKGTVKPNESPAETSQVSFAMRVEPHLDPLLQLVPQGLLEGLSINKTASPDFLTVQMKGTLNREYGPQEAQFSASVNLANLTAAMGALPAGGTLDGMNISVSAGYQAQRERLQGTVTGDFNFSLLGYGGILTIGQTNLVLRSNFNGSISQAFELRDLLSQDQLVLEVKDIVYDDQSLQAAINQVRLSSKTQENIFRQDYSLEELRISSAPLFDLALKGRYRANDQQFAMTANMPSLKVGEILNRLSGDMVEGLSEIQPKGTIALSLNTAGRVPQQADIDQLVLPLDFAAQITLADVEGAFAQHRISGANGTVTVALEPGDQSMAKVHTDLRVDDIHLAPGPGLPVNHLSGAIAQVDIASRDFDEVTLDQIHLGMKGADFSLTGVLTGVKELVAGKGDLRTTIEKFFAQIATNTSVELDEFQDLLGPAGVEGSGKAQVGLSVLKKERGPLDVRLTLDSQKLNVRQDGMKVTELDGAISFRKHLVWNAGSDMKRSSPTFNPTDVLSQLRAATGGQKNLKIDEVDLGLLTISNLSTDVLFDRNTFKIHNLAMNTLGGGLGGNLVLTSGNAFGLSARFEAAQLDFNQLLLEDLKIADESTVDGVLTLAIFFDEQTGALDLSHTEMTLHMTHIGKDTLDRLLLFLDPEGSNPTIVGARSKVKLANPSSVTIQMRRGMLGFEILFSQGLLSSFKMDRIPVGSIKNLQNLTQGIPNWQMVTEAMALVGAESYGVDETGKFVIR